MDDIHKATERGKIEIVREILSRDRTFVHSRTTGLVPDNQPLHLAAWHGRKKIAECLLDAGADVNSCGDGGRTPLHYAVEKGAKSIVKLLIERNANLNQRSESGCTALYLAASTGDESLTRLLVEAGAERDLNSRIYLDGADEVIDALRANPRLLGNAVRPATLLIDAIRVESSKLVEFLLAHGVGPNDAGWTKLPPLFKAIATRNVALVRTLLEHGADTTAKDHIGQGVLAFAEQYGAGREIVSALIKAGTSE